MKHGSTYLFVVCIACALLANCSKKEVPVLQVFDTDNNKMVILTGEKTNLVNFYNADFVILGGSMGGIAAAISICSSGRTAILVEETDRIAGCFSYQDTSYISDNSFIDSSGSSISYQMFRSKIKKWYADRSQKPPEFYSEYFHYFDDFGSNNICFETEAALDVINEMLEENIKKGKLTVLKRLKVAKAVSFYNRISSLIAVDLDNKVAHQLTGWMYIDATRTGDLIPIIGIRRSTGHESREQTGEPHAPEAPDSLVGLNILYYKNPYKSNKEMRNRSFEVELYDKPREDGAQKLNVFRKPRRIRSRKIITEQDIAAEFNEGPRARFFEDSVGIGFQPIHLERGPHESDHVMFKTKPFQIPLGALLPIKYNNVIFGSGNIGTTYIASTAYDSPSIRWAIGEAAGEAAAFCAGKKIYTDELTDKIMYTKGLQIRLVRRRGIPIFWYDDVKPSDDDFVEAQLKPFEEPEFRESLTTLSYRNSVKNQQQSTQ
ncbi:MAG: FAD-dependent oxidoreductase [Candidatus Latescibacteria bacterium]|nr:FAD-dependent oxidoreductase [Candidatus Latescibacterota bacterium]